MAENSSSNYYALLRVSPSASVQQIRRAYRELSKLYHPDTTELPAAIATTKFQELNDAYATLSSPDRRASYDLRMGYSRVSVMQAPSDLNRPVSESRKFRSSAYLEPHDRPLSAGEIFALFILGVTFVACLILVLTISLTRGEKAFEPLTASGQTPLTEVEVSEPSSLSPEPAQPSIEQFLIPRSKAESKSPLSSPDIKSPSELPSPRVAPSATFTFPSEPVEQTPPIQWNSSPSIPSPDVLPPTELPSFEAEPPATSTIPPAPIEQTSPAPWGVSPSIEPSSSNDS